MNMYPHNIYTTPDGIPPPPKREVDNKSALKSK